MTKNEFDDAMISAFNVASRQGNPIASVKEVVDGFFPNLDSKIHEDVLDLRLESSRLSVRVDKPNSFRTFMKNNPAVGTMSGVTDGRPCDAKELVHELIEFAAVRNAR